MTKSKDILARMAKNPAGDWRIEDLISIADRVGLNKRKPTTGSHYVFASPYIDRIETVPYKRPIKAVYIRKFVMLAESHMAAKERENERE